MQAMQKRLLSNPKIEVLWQTEIVEAFGNEGGNLGERLEGNLISDLDLDRSRSEFKSNAIGVNSSTLTLILHSAPLPLCSYARSRSEFELG